MQYYMAPLEGITTYIFRQTYHEFYPDFDKYFTPFLASRKLSRKEQNEVLPENNEGMLLVPQILSNNLEIYLEIALQLKELGYETVNLNLGCPSGTVAPKRRGAGQLADVAALDEFFEKLFEVTPLKVSVKTRVGMSDVSEWEDILAVYEKYPLEELIIHPRLREDYYKGNPRMECFDKACSRKKDGLLNCELCYNGDIKTLADCDRVTEKYDNVRSLMIGRGILERPWLLSDIKEGNGDGKLTPGEIDRLLQFHLELADNYCYCYGKGQDKNVLFKLKDVWSYLGKTFQDFPGELRSVRRASTIIEYKTAVRNILLAVR